MKGIVDAPDNAANRFELSSDKPEMVKHLFTYFKNLRVRTIHIRFSKTGMTMFARDHSRKSRALATFPGEKMNWYYCESEFWLAISADNYYKLFGFDKKDTGVVNIEVEANITTHLTVKLLQLGLSMPYQYKVPATKLDPDDAGMLAMERELESTPQYPVEFTLETKNFKKLISDIAAQNPTVTFQKDGFLPLTLAYTSSNKSGIEFAAPFTDSDKIKLTSTVKENKLFECTADSNNIKALAASLVTPQIRIKLRETGDLLFHSDANNGAMVLLTFTARSVKS